MSLADTVPTLPVGHQGPVGVTPGQSILADADSSLQRNMLPSGALGASPLDQAFSQALAAPNGNGVHVQVLSAALMPTPCIDCCLALWHTMLRGCKVQVLFRESSWLLRFGLCCMSKVSLNCLSLSVAAAFLVLRLAAVPSCDVIETFSSAPNSAC